MTSYAHTCSWRMGQAEANLTSYSHLKVGQGEGGYLTTDRWLDQPIVLSHGMATPP